MSGTSARAYEIDDDTYCYAGTSVLRNRAGLRDQRALTRFETVMTAQRFDEPLPAGRLGVAHYQAVHRHIFQDVYPWAGRFRSVRIAKGGSAFCYPEHIPGQMSALFRGLRAGHHLRGLDAVDFADRAAAFLATLNAIHPFRDGNGRSQTAFLLLIARKAGHPLNMAAFRPDLFLAAMIESFAGSDTPLRRQIHALVV